MKYVFLVYLFVLMYAIVTYIHIRSLNFRKKWYQEFKIAGYEVSENFVSDLNTALNIPKILLGLYFLTTEWTIKKNGLEFNINLTKIRDRTAFTLNFILPKYFPDRQSLRIEKRGAVVKLLDWNKGEYNYLNEDFAIYGSNLRLVEYLLSNKINTQKLSRITDKCSEIDLELPLEYSCRDIHSLLELCDDVIEFVDLLKSFKNYYIHNNVVIGEILENLRMDLVNLECVICYQKVEVKSYVVMNCCSSIGHESHISLWLDTKGTCPYCRRQNVNIYRPQTYIIENH